MAILLRRLEKIIGLFLGITLLLIVRLAYLQLWHGPELATAGILSRVQEASTVKLRGAILDRNLQPLTNRQGERHLIFFPSDKLHEGELTSALAPLLSVSQLQEVTNLAEKKRPAHSTFTVEESVGDYINQQLQLPGVLAVQEKLRYDPASIASHVLGYVNADNHGVSGIEALYDSVLTSRQEDAVAALVDADREPIPGLGYRELELGSGDRPGQVVLTLDERIQRKVEKIVDQYLECGAVVVMDPTGGDILALVSRPNFSGNAIENYLHNQKSPLVNRAVTAFQPGSVFKLVVAAAALDLHLAKPEDIFYDHGYIDIDRNRFYGWDYEQGPRGKITFQDALAFSSNPVFIEVGQKIGAQKLLEYARKLGFGQKTFLDFPGEQPGNLPNYKTVFAGDLANLSIGQGTCEATPLQIAALLGTIVNQGIQVEPYLVSRVISSVGENIWQAPPKPRTRVLAADTCQELQRMMTAVTHYGTGQAANVAGGAAGKTGSAETGRRDSAGKGVTHAWFAGYAPLTQPRYVIVVFWEEGHSGGDAAAPLFHEIATALLNE